MTTESTTREERLAVVSQWSAEVTNDPTSFVAHYNLGVALRDVDRWEDAASQFEAAIYLKPDLPDAYNNLGLAASNLGRHAVAVACFRQAITQNHNFPDAHFNLALALLKLGQFPEGFAEFEWRWQTDQLSAIECPHPKWNGDYVPGTLMIHTEQGSGDALQFARYLPWAAERCKRLLVVCPERLHRIYETIPGIDELRPAGSFAADEFQAYLPLLSLPLVFQTTVETVPNQVPYIQAPSERIPLPPPAIPNPRLKVGLNWAGKSSYLADEKRSCTPREFMPLLQVPDIAYYSLQFGEGADQLPMLGELQSRVVDLNGLHDDFADTAGLMEQLDVIVSVDTAPVHLAGALARPVCVAVAYDADWRWLLFREDSCWYPTARVFRQSQPGNWESVFTNIATALQQFNKE